jgi:hypothetical protein
VKRRSLASTSSASYTDDAGVAKRALVAHAPDAGIALSGIWTRFRHRLAGSGRRISAPTASCTVSAAPMKGPVAAAIVARAPPERVPITLHITTDEETTTGAR